MKPRTLAVAVALSGLLLGGCASPLANKRADVAAIQTIEQNATQARYNFDGSVRIKAMTLPDGLGRFVDNDLPLEIARSFSFDMRGAVDMSTSRIELVPTLRFSRSNLESWVRIPMLAELNTLTLWVDPSAFDLAAATLRGENKGKLVRFQAPPDKIRDWPIQAVLAELPQVVKNIYAAVDKQAYTFQPLDEQARQMGASYRIRLTLDPAAEMAMSKTALKELALLARRHAGEHKKDIDGLIAAIEPLVEASRDELQSSSQTDLLVSRSGKLLGVVEVRDFTMPKEKKLSVTVESVLRLSNHDKPQFTMLPTAANVVNFTDLQLPSWLDKAQAADDTASADDAATDDEADSAEADAASAPSVAAPPVARPHHARKAPAKARR